MAILYGTQIIDMSRMCQRENTNRAMTSLNINYLPITHAFDENNFQPKCY